MNKIVRLTESQFHNFVKQCVNEALNEIDPITASDYARGRQAQANGKRPLSPAQQRVQSKRGAQTLQQKANQGYRDAIDAFNKKYDDGSANYNNYNTFKMSDGYSVINNQYQQNADGSEYERLQNTYDPATDSAEQEYERAIGFNHPNYDLRHDEKNRVRQKRNIDNVSKYADTPEPYKTAYRMKNGRY